MSPLIGLSSSYLQSVLGAAFQGSGSTNNGASATSGAGASSATSQTDGNQLSPFAQLMSELQQLQQSDPSKFQQVTQQISTNLQSAAQTAQTEGNSTAASQLNQLAADFKSASQSGQLPNIQDLAKAIGGHGHHHHSHSASEDSTEASSAGPSSNPTSQLLAAFQASASQADSLNPTSIIMNTLASAGISGANS